MNKLLLAGGLSMGLALAHFGGFLPSADAGWGPPFACGSGTNTVANIEWDNSIPDPAPKAVITGITASETKKASEDSEWTIEELKKAKPLMVYYFVNTDDPTDDNYKLSRKLEMGAFGADKVVKQIKDNWRAKKVGLDMEEDLSEKKNQARVEFWSFMNTKMDTIDIKETKLLKARTFVAKLKKFSKKNTKLAQAEIKRIEKLEKEAAEQEELELAGETASK